MKLFNAVDDNGVSAAGLWPGGRCAYAVWGTFGGGAVTIEVRFDPADDWVTASGSTRQQAGADSIPHLPVCQLRARLAGATTPELHLRVNGLRPL